MPCTPSQVFKPDSARLSGLTGGNPANLGGISTIDLVMRTGTGLRSPPYAGKPNRCASKGPEPPPQKGSKIFGNSPLQEVLIWDLASDSTSGSLLFSQTTNRSRISKRRLRSAFCSSSDGNLSGWADGSSTSDAHNTALNAAKGRRAHHKCNVDGCPCLINFSRADSLFITSSGRATSMSLGL